ncbi:glutamate synthase [Bacteroides graminisolvens DSM 19988 = JCM 15093]|uniref:Glutamate synthase n=2 Tax=Bacteroides graminisolvens TaxID=477666 RepID=A0A069CXZ6_9BACE|nr:glutamate synthase [Bacteroides graminisolvens DSM 19988 = JCM 15093]
MKATGKKEIIEADLVLLAMGFLKPEVPQYAQNVFAAGDYISGPSLVVRAMSAAKEMVHKVDQYLSK